MCRALLEPPGSQVQKFKGWGCLDTVWPAAEDKRKTRKGRQNKRVSKQDTTGQSSITQFMTKKRKTETTRRNPKKRGPDTSEDETQANGNERSTDGNTDSGGEDNEADTEKTPKERSRKKQNRTGIG